MEENFVKGVHYQNNGWYMYVEQFLIIFLCVCVIMR